MNSTLIAVAVKDLKVSPHAGRALTWEVYVSSEAQPEPTLCWEINLSETGCLHEWHVRPDNQRHPLHSVDVAIAISGGEGVKRRLEERNTLLVETAETDPVQAVLAYIKGTLQPGLGHDEAQCLDPDNHQRRSQLQEQEGSH